jgi:hypothetical protein
MYTLSSLQDCFSHLVNTEWNLIAAELALVKSLLGENLKNM